MRKIALEFRNVELAFDGEMIHDFSLNVAEGEYVAMIGVDGSGNGALLQAFLRGDALRSGTILVEGRPCRPAGIREAHKKGVFVIPKESSLINTQTIAENVFCNNDNTGKRRVVNERLICDETDRLLREFELPADARALAGELSPELKCIIEAVKWHAFGARILILNNVLPSTVFWERTFARLCASGTTVLHLMNRCVAPFARADRCVLLSPSGRIARTIYADSFDPAWINRYIGRRATRKGWPASPVQPGEEILRADDVRVEGLRGLTFSLHRGEAVGLLCDDSEQYNTVAHALYGLCGYRGSFYIRGKRARIACPADACKRGIGFLPSDSQKLFYPDLSAAENAIMPFMRRVGGRTGVIKQGRIRALTQDTDACLEKLMNVFQGTDRFNDYMLSILSRFLMYPYEVIILDRPSDINDVLKEDMIGHLIDLSLRRGRALLIVSTHMEELKALCTRVIVPQRCQ